MRIFISSDIEGTAGIAHWDETEAGHFGYEPFRRQMSLEVAAACEGAFDGGADEVLVKDAHDSARNIDPNVLPEQAQIFRGWGMDPLCMVVGLERNYSGVIFTGYHSAAGTDFNPLAHTMTTQNNSVHINGELASELYIHALAAAYLNVPVLMVTGDEGLCRWMNAKNPDVVTVPVSAGMGRGSISIHPAKSVKLIREAAQRAVGRIGRVKPFELPDSFEVEICYKEHSEARRTSFYPGAKLLSSHRIGFKAEDYMDVLRFFHFVL